MLPRVVAQRSLAAADDIGAVLISRLRHATLGRQSGARRQPNLIAGLVPVADGPMPDSMRRALTERQHLLEVRATTLAKTAVAQKAPWSRRLGAPPTDPRQREAWMQEVRVVAYRDLWQVDSDSPVGVPGDSDRQRFDEARARKAARRAAGISTAGGALRGNGLANNGPTLA